MVVMLSSGLREVVKLLSRGWEMLTVSRRRRTVAAMPRFVVPQGGMWRRF